MRVVGGVWRGRSLVAPPGRGTRPTSDKVREAIFDVLAALPDIGTSVRGPGAADVLAGQAALDLFAGSGGLGIEALSRGARTCTFVEKERSALRALRANLCRLGVDVTGGTAPAGPPSAGTAPRARLLAGDVRVALAADARRGSQYTLVFADPPYDRFAEVRLALVRLLRPLLTSRAVVVLETAAGTLVELPWTVVREKRYGDTQVTFLVAEERQRGEGAAADDDGPAT
jgi:16S rRNA (guanine966-N2)-methyltransferase